MVSEGVVTSDYLAALQARREYVDEQEKLKFSPFAILVPINGGLIMSLFPYTGLQPLEVVSPQVIVMCLVVHCEGKPQKLVLDCCSQTPHNTERDHHAYPDQYLIDVVDGAAHMYGTMTSRFRVDNRKFLSELQVSLALLSKCPCIS